MDKDFKIQTYPKTKNIPLELRKVHHIQLIR